MKFIAFFLLALLPCCSCSRKALTAVERTAATAADTLRASQRTDESRAVSAAFAERFSAFSAADTVRDSVSTLLVVDTAGRVVYRERTLWHDSRRSSVAATAAVSRRADTVARSVTAADTVRTSLRRSETATSTVAVEASRPWYKKTLETMGGFLLVAALLALAFIGIRERNG